MANTSIYGQIQPWNLVERFRDGQRRAGRKIAGELAADGDYESAADRLYRLDDTEGAQFYTQQGQRIADREEAARMREEQRQAAMAEAERRRRMAGYLQSGDYSGAQGVAAESGDVETTLKLGDRRRQTIGDALQAYHDRVQSLATLPADERQAAWGELVQDLKNDRPEIVGDPSFYSRYDTQFKPGALAAYIGYNARQKGLKIEEAPRRKVVSEDLGGRKMFRYEDAPDALSYAEVTAKPKVFAPGEDSLTPVQARKTETDLRKEFISNSKDFLGVRDAYSQIKTLSDRAGKDPAADIAFLISYMKMLDPASVVREGEFATAQNAAGVPDRVRNLYNNVYRGTRLGPDQVQDFTRQSRSLYQSRLDQHQRDRAQYRDFATGYGVNPDVAVPNLALPDEAPTAASPVTAFDQLPAPGPLKGRTITDKATSKRYQSDGVRWSEIR